MQPASRSLLWAAYAWLVTACGGPGVGPVGVSPPRAVERDSFGAEGGAPAAAAVPPDFRTKLTRVTERFLSQGHGLGFDAVIWENDLARGAADPQTDLPEGARFVEEAIVHDAQGDRPAGFLVMTKEKDAIRFDAQDADGRVAGRERVAPCAACHGEARGSVFPAAGVRLLH